MKESLPAGPITLINQRPVGEDLHVRECPYMFRYSWIRILHVYYWLNLPVICELLLITVSPLSNLKIYFRIIHKSIIRIPRKSFRLRRLYQTIYRRMLQTQKRARLILTQTQNQVIKNLLRTKLPL